ncbi:MAG TPA: hypothetical protein VGK67_17070 [Myxococcales bacterium]|jgi:uncharacterized protein YnzC (UPF0291/DUF896 family)
MDVSKKIEEFIALNAKAKTRPLSEEELARWETLKNGLIATISREPPPPSPPETT